jgi:CP family cyanate transporter-like MFS transporter
MAQAIGYTMAAVTPILIGFIHDLTGQWTIPLLLMIGLAILQLVMGYLAGRPLRIGAVVATPEGPARQA